MSRFIFIDLATMSGERDDDRDKKTISDALYDSEKHSDETLTQLGGCGGLPPVEVFAGDADVDDSFYKFKLEALASWFGWWSFSWHRRRPWAWLRGWLLAPSEPRDRRSPKQSS